MKALLNGKEVKVLDAAKGWIKIEIDGEVKSVRRAELDFLPEPQETLAAASTAAEAAKANAAPEPAAVAASTSATSTEKGKTMATKKSGKSKKTAAKKDKAKAAKPRKASAANGTATMRTVDGKEYSYARAGKTASGNTAYDNGDEVAQKLRGKTIDEVYAITAKAMLKKGGLKGDFAKCETAEQVEKKLRAGLKDANAGRQRMTLGNRLRAALRAAE